MLRKADCEPDVRLSVNSLFRMYSDILWADVIGSAPIPKFYNGFATVGLIKAHLLIYLVKPLASERALARELGERTVLQDVCGFTERGEDGHRLVPTRATLWHFRRRFIEVFPDIILRGLVALAVVAKRYGETLEMIESPPVVGIPQVAQRFGLSKTGIHGELIFYDHQHERRDQTSLFPESGLYSHDSRIRKKSHLSETVVFPIEVRFEDQTSELHTFVLVKPAWLNMETRVKDLSLGNDFGEKRPYTACNVVITRQGSATTEILLAQRLSGSGRGMFALPGGKKRPDESVLQCAEREVFEETGLRLDRESLRPISIDYTNLPGFPRVKSVGIHAPKWSGSPRRREPHIHSEWQWVAISDLPNSIFEPSRLVLQAFLDTPVVTITWEEVEEPLPLWRRDEDF
jgi:8-oxo-dGTP diphosphatase